MPLGYAPAARKTVWSLTLPQVAATLAATLVAYKTFIASGQPLLDSRMLNGVLIMVLVTSILGPVLTAALCATHAGTGAGSPRY